VHRDLKPSNVVISDPQKLETVKIVDFGLAIKVQLKHGLDDTCGTLVYQAPEQMFGEVSYGKAIDLWATGLIMYELITGQHAIWQKGEDKPAYKEKMKAYKGLKLDTKRFSQ
jgi:cyclin-dependent kinase-like